MRKFWESIYCPNYITGYDPFELKGMKRAINRLALAINNRQKIVIYGTYNVDGICAVSSLILLLRYLNADVEYLIYDRQDNDARINSKDIKENVDFLGAELLITLGVGLKSKDEVELCKKLGIDLIILENEVFIKEGNKFLVNTNNNGLRSIIEFNKIEEFDNDGVDTIIDFLVPPIGAVGVTDNARIVLELLTTNDKDRSNQIVKYLYRLKKNKVLSN